jgi:hypothetical protein
LFSSVLRVVSPATFLTDGKLALGLAEFVHYGLL